MECTERKWKDVVGYEGRYLISDKGEVYSCLRNIIMKASVNGKGYLSVGLIKDGKQTPKRIHRLVAEAFIPNPNNYPQVNHRDEVKTNNAAENLEWCTDDYNRHYGTVIERNAAKHRKEVNQYSIDGQLIKTWEGVNVAARALGIQGSHITECCQGKHRTTGGFVWSYD